MKKSLNGISLDQPWALLGVLALTVVLSPVFAQAQTSNPDTKPDKPAATVPVQSLSGQDEVLELSPFEVKSLSDEDGYLAKTSASSSRIAVDYLDLAQTVDVITKQFISDYNIQDIRKLFENIPNVYTGSQDQSNRIWIRGSEVTSIYVDGVAGFQSGAPPLQFFDRVEVVKGPSSSAFGVGQPGGIINYTIKAPTGKTGTDVSVGVGSYNSYLANFDTQGVVSSDKYGKTAFRLVGFYDQGNYQIAQEKYRGVGALLSLRHDFSDTVRVSGDAYYSRTYYPVTDNNLGVYKNQTAYTWLMTNFGAAGNSSYPALPGSNPYPGDAAAEASNGKWAGGQLLPAGANGYADNFNPAGTNNDFRASASIENSFFGKSLTIKNTVTFQTGVQDNNYISAAQFAYINPATGQPFDNSTTGPLFPNNTYVGTLDQLGEAPFILVEHYENIFRAYNLDINYKRSDFLWGNWNFAAGFSANESDFYNHSTVVFNTFVNPDGSKLWFMFDSDKPRILNLADPRSPASSAGNYKNVNYAWGEYVTARGSYFQDRVAIEAGTRWNTGVGHSDNFDTNTRFSGAKISAKQSPRFALSVKPLKWLSLYVMRAEHADPAAILQKYTLFAAGNDLAALKAKYHNFDNPFSYTPKGVNKELGAKAEFFKGKLAMSVDVFDFTTAGGAITNVIGDHDPASPTFNSTVIENLLSDNHAKGGEFTIAGRLWDHLLVTGYYGITRGRNSPFPDGRINYIDPPTTTGLHAKYDFRITPTLTGYVLGGGTRFGPYLNWQQGFYVHYDTPQYVYDGGAGVAWDKGRQAVEFVANNIQKKLLFISANTSYASGSEPQMFVKYKYKF